jgi:hypothetical protein
MTTFELIDYSEKYEATGNLYQKNYIDMLQNFNCSHLDIRLKRFLLTTRLFRFDAYTLRFVPTINLNTFFKT